MRTIPEIIRKRASELENMRREMERTGELQPDGKLLFELIREDSPCYELAKRITKEPGDIVLLSFSVQRELTAKFQKAELGDAFRNSAEGSTFVVVMTDGANACVIFTRDEPWASQFEKQMADDRR